MYCGLSNPCGCRNDKRKSKFFTTKFSFKMSDFGLGDSSSGGLDSSKRAQVMDQVKSQIAVAAAQELKCIALCMDRYMDSWNTVSRAYNARLQREHSSGGLH
ncbi:mitochondrial import inner membrane translocase subunit Tim13-A [Exaiptasia diaphana]|uniref:Mitochondrial import inner membrane translocase subunit n=1 Tax=Exaiptasia diaphana TaxID=2652724 RepID=A0A913YDV2_EXADI|nr:mitochondrial import inner membrane translocase subunit Tim13-A [Exaiptasia diaphana]